METNELTDHAYDGIQEYDNPLPGWWKWTFAATILFSLAYAMYYHVGAPGRTILEKYEVAVEANTRLQFGELGDVTLDEQTLARFLHDDKWLRVGAGVFQANCQTCHGRYGQGNVGPNLTDEYYKNVRNLMDIAKIVNQGAGNGAMPAWESRLDPLEVIFVSSYVASLRGTETPAEGKGPEGSTIPEWPDAPAEAEVESEG